MLRNYGGFFDTEEDGGGDNFANARLQKNSMSSDGNCTTPDDFLPKKTSFKVRYIGCIEIKTSVKTLDFKTRAQLARECINLVCEAAGLKSQRKRRPDKKLTQYISERPCMQNSGANVKINVTKNAISLRSIETGEMIVNHDLPRISFASGGDQDTLDFLAYIAKNLDGWRACYVLECGGDQSQELLSTIGTAFTTRFKALNLSNYNIKEEYDKDYYNDLPDKLPPDLLFDNDLPQQVTQLHLKKPRHRLSSNLIDLNSPPPDHIPKVDLSLDANSNNNSAVVVRDVFDIQPFSLSAEVQRSQLMTESWFHPSISRPVAEGLLKNDGDFLVRESQGKPGQYVLTGLENTTPKHLLLIDPEGIVRTKDRIFDSISHLINYHWTNSLPIISEETELVLRTPVLRSAQK